MDQNHFTIEEYNQFEEEKSWPHEYLNGKVTAREEATLSHSAATTNVSNLLHSAAKHSELNYQVFDSRVKYHIADENVSLYPDVSIVQRPVRRSEYDIEAITNPILIIEVFSDHSAAYDRGEKFYHYRRLTTLQEYVLIDLDQWSIETRCRSLNGSWQMQWVGEGDNGYELILNSVGVTLALQDIYRDVEEFNFQAFEQSNDLAWKRHQLVKKGGFAFGSAGSFQRWLKKPALGLDMRVPFDLLHTNEGINEVWYLILSFEHGIYI